jgi:predicted MPP superfamily phosphohydrolase
MNIRPRVLIIDDDADWRETSLKVPLESLGYQVDTFKDRASALLAIQHEDFDLAVLNIHLRPDIKENTVISQWQELLFLITQKAEAIVVSFPDFWTGTPFYILQHNAFKNYGAYDVFTKDDFDTAQYVKSAREAIDKQQRKKQAATTSVSGGQMFSWLHLSDLHIGSQRRNQDWGTLKNALLQDLCDHQLPPEKQAKRLAGVTFRPNAIFITGDIAYKGAEEEYKEAESFLKDVWRVVGFDETTGKECTFVVPGNHDVARSVVKDSYIYDLAYEKLAAVNTSQQAWVGELGKLWQDRTLRDLISKKFEFYLEFVRNCTTLPTDELYYVRQIAGTKVTILGLNSAIMSWKDGEDTARGLWIGRPQIAEVEKTLAAQDNAFCIALVHHPREALHAHDSAWERIQKISPILLHGHLHELKAYSVSTPELKHFCLPGGSTHEGDVWRSQHYSYGQFDLAAKTLDLYLRMTKPGEDVIYICDNQTYPNAGADGHIRLSLA